MSFHGCSLAVEGIVCGSDELVAGEWELLADGSRDVGAGGWRGGRGVAAGWLPELPQGESEAKS